jgi:hypothetical protein
MELKEIYGVRVSKCGVVYGKRGRPIVANDNGRGYPIVSVYIDGKRTSKAVHRLVAEAWLPNPENLPEVNHKDCDRSNPTLSNLEWCTHGYNISYSYDTKNRSAEGDSNARCITTVDTVKEICSHLQVGLSSAAIRDLGYDYSLVRAIKSRKNWTHVSNKYIW